MAKAYVSSPIFSISPGERAMIEQQLKKSPVYNPDLQDITESFGGRDIIGARNFTIGATGWRLGYALDGLLNDEPGDPMNFEKRRAEVDPLRDPLSFTMNNNPDGYAEDLKGVPFEEWSWVLSARNYGEYQKRLAFIKAGLPEWQEEGSVAGAALGFTGDLAAFMSVGMAAEPLALAGLGARTTLAGRAAATSGAFQSQALGQAAANAAATVSRMNLAARYTALGIAEEAVFQAVKNGIDPLYDPSVSDVIEDFVYAGTFSGVIGGAVFGRRFLKDNIEEAASELIRAKTVNLPGGYTVTYAPRLVFDSPAAADEMLFAKGTGSFEVETNRIGQELWDDWQRDPTVDLNIPGTRTVNIGQAPVTEASGNVTFRTDIQPRDVLVEDPTQSWRSPGRVVTFKTSKGSSYELYPDRTTVRNKAARPEHPGDKGLQPRSSRTYFVTQEAADELSVIQASYYQGKHRVQRRITTTPDGSQIGVEELSGRFKGRIRSAVAFSDEPQVGMLPVEVWPDGRVHFGNKITEVGQATSSGFVRAPGKQVRLQRTGVRSVIKTAAWELQLAGVKLNAEAFGKLARALVRVEKSAVTGGAFNKRFWDEVLKEFPDTPLRNPKERAFIGGVDRTVMDVVAREDMVDSVWSTFRRNGHEGVDTKGSLIFRVLSEIRSRGGTVDRRVVGEVIDSLREVSQNPPMRTNKGGRKVVDKNMRRAQVANIVNKYAKSDKQITIAENLLENLSGKKFASAATKAGTRLPDIERPADGTDLDSIPRSKAWWERVPGLSNVLNQSAKLIESENPSARLVGWLAFGAKRSFEIAQPQTIFEAGSIAAHSLQFAFMRGYRNGLFQFALGDGANKATIVDGLRLLAPKNRGLRKEFNRRVSEQLRTGNYDDVSQSINDTARGFRELLNKIHEMAHSVGLAGFQTSAVNNYMPRMWRWDLIRRLGTTEEGRQALKDLVKQAIDKNGRKIVVDGVEETIEGDIDQAATVFSNRLMNIARQTENAPLIAQEQELVDAIMELKGPIKGPGGPKGGTPFGRKRTLLDETARLNTGSDLLNIGRNEISMADLLNDDLPYVMKKYIYSIIGAINQKRFFTAFNDELRARGVLGAKYTTKSGQVIENEPEVADVESMIGLIKKLGGPGTVSSGQEEAIRELMEVIRFDPINKGITNVPTRIANAFMNYGYMVIGGQFGFAQMVEISRIVGTLGLMRTIRQMPILTEMVYNYKNLDRDSDNFASFVDSWLSPSTDRLRRAFITDMPETREFQGASGLMERGLGVVERGLNSMANVFSDISGLAPITAFTQQLTAATTLQHLYEASRRGVRRLDNATVRALGLEPEQYEQIIEFVGRNAKTRRGFMGTRIVGMDNLDAKEFDLIRAFVQRMVESRVQSVPTRGDFHKGAFSVWGRIFLQFRTFNLKGVDNFLIQNATRVGRGGGLKVAQEIATTLMFAGVVKYMLNYAEWKSQIAAKDWEKADETENLLGVGGFIRGAFTGPSEFFVPSIVTDAVSWFATGDPVFSPYRYSGLDWFGFPGEAQIKRGLGLARDVYGTTVGKSLGLKTERDVTRDTIRKARLLIPGQNLWFLKWYFNILESEIEAEYNLPSQQPRRKRD